jgi:parallel beta-helix repeat protein
MAFRKMHLPLSPHLLALAALLFGAGCARQPEPGPIPPSTAAESEPIPPSGPAESGPADIYVSPDGEDQASGRSAEDALFSISRALELVSAGERVLILPGVYSETLSLWQFGDPSAPITISGVPGETVLDGGRELATGLWCEACRGLVVEKLVVRNYTDAALVILYSESIVVRDLLVSDSGFEPQLEDWQFEGYGIDVESSSRVQVERNRVTRIGPNPQRPGHMLGSSIVAYDCHECVIRGNTIWENTGGMVVEDSISVLVEGNLLFDNDLDATAEFWWDGAIWLDGGQDVTLRGNTIRDNLGPGLQISDEESAGPTGYVLEDNLVTGNLIGLYLWGFGTSDLPGEPVLRARGNQITGNTLVDVYVSPEWCLAPEPCEPEG